MAVRVAASPRGWLRYPERDALFVALSLAHAAVLVTIPSVAIVAIGLWWNANTISHNFIHRPFFRSATANRTFSAYLSVLLGVPQSVWRVRHLRHHAEGRATPDVAPTCRVGPVQIGASVRRQMLIELGLVCALWITLAAIAPKTFLFVYLPGWAIGLALCQVHGYFEHYGGTTSHYGWVYNALFFNDGYHVEHHQQPGAHWTRLAALSALGRSGSQWPPVLRWIDAVNLGQLEQLERMVLRSLWLQRFVLDRHERAFRKLLPKFVSAKKVLIVGGGLFPRTALVLSKLLPDATLTVVDTSSGNLTIARRFLDDRIGLVNARFDAAVSADADLVVIPLAFRGDRARIYREPPAPTVIVHDWLWARRPGGARVCWLLLKRLNLVRR
jgi:hypothetical protein